MKKLYPLLNKGLLTKKWWLFIALITGFGMLPAALLAQAPTMNYGDTGYPVLGSYYSKTPTSINVSAPGYSSTPVTFPNTATSFNQTSGIAIDIVQNIKYVSDRLNNKIWAISADGVVTEIANAGVSQPAGLVFDGARYIYIADAGNNVIKKTYSGNGSSPTIIGTGFNQPNAVALDATGNLFVSDYGNNAIKKIINVGGGIITVASGLNHPGGVAVDAAGNVYFSDSGNNQVKKIAAGGGVPMVIGSGFSNPRGLAVDASGNIFVADKGNSAVKMIPAAGGTPITIGSGFNQPEAVTLGTRGILYVADTQNDLIKTITPVGGYYSDSLLPNGLILNNATGVASGIPALAGYSRSNITSYNNATAFTSAGLYLSINLSGNAPVFSYPADITLTAGVNVKIRPVNSNPLPFSFGLYSTALSDTNFNRPYGVAVVRGNIYVADKLNNAIVKIPVAGGRR